MNEQHRDLCRSRKRKRGLAAVEAAIVLPLVLTLMFAAIDFGRVMYAYLVVSNAARCGAEYGSMHGFTSYVLPTWQSQIRSIIGTEMGSMLNYNASNLQFAWSTTTDSSGLAQITVTASYPFTTIVSWPGVPSQIQLSHTVVMRQIR